MISLRSDSTPSAALINNDVYDTLGDRWYDADDDPVALLRAEARFRTPWVLDRLYQLGARESCRVLDIGCGGGFLSNDVARAGYRVTGIDVSEQSLEVARRHDVTGTVDYRTASAYELPFEAGSFDAVCALDFLEHVTDPAKAIAEAGRVLRPGGLFFFYTFNRTLLSRILVIELVERVVRNVPPNLHLHEMFIRPDELSTMCRSAGIESREIRGVRPDVLSWDFVSLFRTGQVPPSFQFRFTRSLAAAYLGYGVKQAGPAS